MYILVCTGTDWYVLVHTWKKTCDYLIHPGSDLRVKFNSVHVLCKRYDRMKSNLKKCKVQVMHVHISTYWYVLVRTGIDMHHTLHFNDHHDALLARASGLQEPTILATGAT